MIHDTNGIASEVDLGKVCQCVQLHEGWASRNKISTRTQVTQCCQDMLIRWSFCSQIQSSIPYVLLKNIYDISLIQKYFSLTIFISFKYWVSCRVFKVISCPCCPQNTRKIFLSRWCQWNHLHFWNWFSNNFFLRSDHSFENLLGFPLSGPIKNLKENQRLFLILALLPPISNN